MSKPSGDVRSSEAIDRWVRTTLEVSPDANAEECRRAFLEGVGREEFVPLPEWEEALDLLNGSDVRALSFEADHEASLLREIDEFADAFFALGIGERRERWERLRKACWPFPPLRARLDRLEPGLDVDVGGLDTCPDPVRQLGEHVCRLFVLHGREKTEYRRDGFAYRLTGPEFMQAAGAIKLVRPDIEALEPEFIRRLARGGTTVVRRPDTRGRTRYAHQPAQTQEQSSGGEFPWYLLLFVGPVVGLLAGLADNSSKNKGWKPGNSMPKFQPSQHDLRDLQRILTEADQRRNGRVTMHGRTTDGRTVQRLRTEKGELVDSVDGRPIVPADDLVVGEEYLRSSGESAIQYTDATGTIHDVLIDDDLAKRSPGGREVVGVMSPRGPWRQPERGKAVPTPRVAWEPGLYQGRTRDGRVVRRYVNSAYRLDTVDGDPIREDHRLVLAQVVDRPGGRVLVFEELTGRTMETRFLGGPNDVYLRSDGAEIVPLERPPSNRPTTSRDEVLDRALRRLQRDSP